MSARVAVVGHVEWGEFARLPAMPAAGAIVHATEWWEEPGGGGAVAAVQLARLAGTCAFFTALGDDERGARAADELRALGVTVHAARRPPPQRRAIVFTDARAERTITVLGPRLVPHGADSLPWAELAGGDGVYFTGGDTAALERARSARVLVATPRASATLCDADVRLDALVRSASDPGESLDPGDLRHRPGLVVSTRGADGGRWEAADGTSGSWPAAPLPGPPVDAYGCGDSFAAALTYGLAARLPAAAALELAARAGAACLTGRGPYTAQLRLPVAG